MMVDRYFASGGIHPCDQGEYVDYCDYAALEARVAELERDAARYRKMRDLTSWTVGSYGTGVVLTVHCPGISFMQLLGPECGLGKAIDSLEESK